MAWTFRKRKKLFPGVRLNYGSSGLSLNLGVPGASVTVGANGVYANTGLPGTGIRNRKKIVSSASTESSVDSQVTEKDLKRAGCARDLLYYICYAFSYFFIVVLWGATGYMYSAENYWYLIPAIFDLFFIINTIRLHIHHHRANVSSSLTFPIVLSILLMLFFFLCGGILYMEHEPILGRMCIMLDAMWAINLYICFKYRVKSKDRSRKIAEVLNEANGTYSGSTTHITSSIPTITPAASLSARTSSLNNQEITMPAIRKQYVPSFDYTKESLLYFSQNRVRKELIRAYSLETIDICAYVVNSRKCVLSDIQAELGLSYQRVLESVKILERARIVKEENNHRKVMITDETIAIRLLLRYANEMLS